NGSAARQSCRRLLLHSRKQLLLSLTSIQPRASHRNQTARTGNEGSGGMHEDLVRWFEANRRNLPWRSGYNPYHVWISEVMLQQTQVETVLPYFERFITKFPTLKSLASAREEDVLQMWAGLVYYRRARNLLSAIRTVADQYQGRIPDDYDKLIALPGV